MDIHFDLSEMRSRNGTVLRYEVESLVSDFANQIVNRIDFTNLYNCLGTTSKNKIDLYFQAIIKKEIFFSICQLCGLRWKKDHGQFLSMIDKVIYVPQNGIFEILKELWPDDDIKLVLSNDYILSHTRPAICKNDKYRIKRTYYWLKSLVRSININLQTIINKIRYKHYFNNIDCKKSYLALEYNEGINLDRRSDIAWLQNDLIDKSKIIIYFTSLDTTNKSKKISNEIIEKINEMGMASVCLKNGIMGKKAFPIWFPNKKDVINYPKILINNSIDSWMSKNVNILIDEINYWCEFYKKFNVKINFIIGEGHPKYIARRIAADLNDSNCIIVRKQRSELFTPIEMFSHYHPVNIFFTFNNRAKDYLIPNTNRINTLVAAGHTSDYIISKENSNVELLKQNLIDNGVKYTICLLDNVYSRFYDTSKKEISLFYNTFLDLLFNDPSIGIIIKSKKSMVIDNLPEISKKVKDAEEKGRCIRIKNEWGRFPLEGALASNLSIGVSISSAIIEIASMGLPAVMYDMSRFYTHEFYLKGRNKIIFDDLEVLVEKIKKSKNNINSSLGRWKDLNYELDPFNDGKSNYRIEEYINNCLDGFDLGLNANDVIARANKEYSQNWGSQNIHKLD